MENKFRSVAIRIFLAVLAIVVPGCIANRVDLVDKGDVLVDVVPSERVDILWADVFRDDDGIKICGVVQRRSHTSHPIKTHVDVTIVSPNGATLQEARTPDIHVPKRVPGKGANFEHFEVRFSDIVPGSKAKLVVHSGQHDDTTSIQEVTSIQE